MTVLTDLEGAVLAEIARRQTATSYAVAKAQSQSPSEFWSGSAGAVYPAIRRLHERGLLRASAPDDGGHRRTEYEITAAGRQALSGWLLDAHRAAGLGFDPLRSRIVHLDMVSATERQAFLDEVAARTQAASATDWAVGTIEHAVHQSVIQARLDWIATLKRVVT